MKVTPDMINKEIRREFKMACVMPLIFSNKYLLGAFNTIGKRIQVGSNIKSLDCDEIMVPSRNGDHKIRTRIYKPKNYNGKLPVVFHLHGGGLISGHPENAHRFIERIIEKRPCVVISPDYRLAQISPYPAALNDCYDTMVWARNNADFLGIYDKRFVVTGHSAGGGLTAAVTLLNRDRKELDIAFQIPLYPMIDDRQPEDEKRLMITAVWDSRSNKYGWDMYLSELRKNGEDISPYASPARNKDFEGLPPTITLVGDMEPFYWETMEYITGIRNAGISVKFKEYKGCFHGFDACNGKKSIVKDANNFTHNSFAEYFDEYVLKELEIGTVTST